MSVRMEFDSDVGLTPPSHLPPIRDTVPQFLILFPLQCVACMLLYDVILVDKENEIKIGLL